VIINHREDDVTIDEETTVNNIRKMCKAIRLDYIDKYNMADYANFDRPIVAVFSNDKTLEDLEKNQGLYKSLAKALYNGGVRKYPDYQFAIINALDLKHVA
jgi:hypothetical protein